MELVICIVLYVNGCVLPEQRTPWAMRPHMKLAQYSHQCGPLNVCTYVAEGRDDVVTPIHMLGLEKYQKKTLTIKQKKPHKGQRCRCPCNLKPTAT